MQVNVDRYFLAGRWVQQGQFHWDQKDPVEGERSKCIVLSTHMHPKSSHVDTTTDT